MAKIKVEVSKESKAQELLSMLVSHNLVDAFNLEQNTVVVSPYAHEVVVRWSDFSQTEQNEVVFAVTDSCSQGPSETLVEQQAAELLDLLSEGFRNYLYSRHLIAFCNHEDFGPIYIPINADTYSYLLSNAGLEWRGIINEDWSATQTS